MTLEAIIGEDPPQIRMAGEHNAIEVVSLPFIPIRAGKDLDDRGHRRRLIGLDFEANARIVFGRKQMIDDIKAAFAARPIDCRDVDQAPEQAAGIVAQKT